MKLEALLENARANYPALEEYLNIQLDFSLRSIRDLEIAAMIKFPLDYVPKLDIIAALGIYLGEVIEHNYLNAKWLDFEGNNLGNIGITIEREKSETTIFPLVRMNKFWHDRNESLSKFLDFIQDTYGGVLKDSEVWVDSEKGYSYRSREVNEHLMEDDEVRTKINAIKKEKE